MTARDATPKSTPVFFGGRLYSIGMTGTVTVKREPHLMARFDQAVPVLQVNDVSVSMDWYSKILGFEGWAFPKTRPYSFALLNRDGVELMFQKGAGRERTAGALTSGWAVYIRLKGGDLLEVAAQIKKDTRLVQEPTRMPYRDVEFSVEDQDGHVIVSSEQLPDDVDVPSATE